MNIDLLFTADGTAGLIASTNFPHKVVGVLFEPSSGTLSLEFANMHTLLLNIPVEEAGQVMLETLYFPFIGAIKAGHIAQAYQAPLVILGHVMHASMAAHAAPYRSPLLAFESFMTACVTGQPVHRIDLSDEGTVGCVLGSAAPTTLVFAPHLLPQRALEAAPRGPAPKGPGLGLGGGGSTGGGLYIPPNDE